MVDNGASADCNGDFDVMVARANIARAIAFGNSPARLFPAEFDVGLVLLARRTAGIAHFRNIKTGALFGGTLFRVGNCAPARMPAA
ncbi:MAG TPA: hypothetical protein VFL49_01640 [Pseudolabrys sp.]|nr:hypothetical protein [Pseudolabrys sp.]